jgi:2-keto-4-pentenoate hydratase/2-oxohepta-3-ene-1,7-dioic acid hydratase in catechol pathway
MRLASFERGGRVGCGPVAADGIVDLAGVTSLRALIASGKLDRGWAPPEAPVVPFAELAFRPVLADAPKVLCVGRNYADHAAETGRGTTEQPSIFLKHRGAFVGHGQALVAPKASPQFDYEGELAVVIGRGGRHIAAADAMVHVAGYTCLMDGSVRDFQQHSPTAGKNFDRSSSMGPWMVTRDAIPDPAALTLTTRLNGEVVQQSGVDKLIFDIPAVIAYISQWTALEPGDVIATGTPAGVGSKRKPPRWLVPGDVVEVEIEGIGILSNPIVAERGPE